MTAPAIRHTAAGMTAIAAVISFMEAAIVAAVMPTPAKAADTYAEIGFDDRRSINRCRVSRAVRI
jgi:hypothetical protein